MGARIHIGCEHCAICAAVTSHSRRRFAARGWVAFALGLAACAAPARLAGPLGAAVCVLTLLVAAGFWADGRSRRLNTTCDRCRGRSWKARQRERPTLSGNTEINLL